MEVKEERRLGEVIRRTREGKGISLERLSDMTKISKEFIKAIEEERFDALPGDVYVKGFIRNISIALGLDPDEMRELYKKVRGKDSEEIVLKEAKEKLPAYDAKVEKGVKPARPWLLILTLLILLVGGGFYFYASWSGNIATFKASSSVSGVPSQGTIGVEVKGGPVSPSTQTQSDVGSAASLETSSLSSLSTEASKGEPSSLKPEEKVVTSPKMEKYTLKVVATGRCWIRVVADGKKVFEGVLVSGDERVWEAEENITVRFGNISGVKVYFNGEAVALPPSKTGVVDMVFPQ